MLFYMSTLDCTVALSELSFFYGCFQRLEELEKIQANQNEIKNESNEHEEDTIGETDKGGAGAIEKVRPKQENPRDEGFNLLTFSRQKFARFQCEYDQKSCSYCNKVLPPEELKTCIGCSTAKYCSRECQKKDWKPKHKAHCSEIERLRKAIMTGGTENSDNDGTPTPNSDGDMQPQETPIDKANLVTFSRQKLALMQCEYNDKCCNHCGQSGGLLKTCSRCKTAKYCSQECQTDDWKKKHKIHCREIMRLRELIAKESKAKVPVEIKTVRRLAASPSGASWFLKDYMIYGRMVVYQNKLVLCGTDTGTFSSVIDVYDTATHEKVGSSCFIRLGDIVSGLCSITMGNKPYIAISTENSFDLLKQHRFELWSFPSRRPLYTYTTKPNTFTVIHSYEGTMLIANELEKTIHEFNVSSTPFKSTGNNF